MNRIANKIISSQLIDGLVTGCWNELLPRLKAITKQYINATNKDVLKKCLTTYNLDQLANNLKQYDELIPFTEEIVHILENELLDLILAIFKKDVRKIRELDKKRYELKQQGKTDAEIDQEFYKYYNFSKNTIEKVHNQLVKRYIDLLIKEF